MKKIQLISKSVWCEIWCMGWRVWSQGLVHDGRRRQTSRFLQNHFSCVQSTVMCSCGHRWVFRGSCIFLSFSRQAGLVSSFIKGSCWPQEVTKESDRTGQWNNNNVFRNACGPVFARTYIFISLDHVPKSLTSELKGTLYLKKLPTCPPKQLHHLVFPWAVH